MFNVPGPVDNTAAVIVPGPVEYPAALFYRMQFFDRFDVYFIELGVRRRPNSNQAGICVLGFSANRVWLVNRFYISTNYYKARTFSIPTINTVALYEVLLPNGLTRRSLDMEVRESQVRSPDQDLFLFFFVFVFVSFRFSFSLVLIVFQFFLLFFILFFIHFIFIFHYIWVFIASVGPGRLAASL